MNKDIRVMNYGPSLESSELAFKWLSKNNNKFGHFINGKMTTPKNTFETINPATAARITYSSNEFGIIVVAGKVASVSILSLLHFVYEDLF